MRTIRQQLLFWILGSILITIFIASISIYRRVSEESRELFDYQLAQLAAALPSTMSAPTYDPSESHVKHKDIVFQVWDDSGKLIYTSHDSKLLPPREQSGFSTTIANGEKWRVFSEITPGRHVQVSQLLTTRDKLVYDAGARALKPFLYVTPLLAIIISLVLRQVLAPLRRIVIAVEQRSANSLHPISTADIPPDILPMIIAINDLLARLDQSLSAQRAFVADASHELRSPLTAIKLQLQLAERAQSEEERALAYHKLNDRLDRSSHLVHQLLTLARHEPEISSIDFKTVDLVKIAQEVVSDILIFAESRSIELGVRSASQPVNVQANGDWLAIMLRNLVDNAIRYTPIGGNVEIDILVDNSMTRLKVTDNGPGIPLPDHERVFDRFYRREGETMQGTGLGLSIVKSIVMRHGGNISLDRASEDGGLAVTISFDSARLIPV
jgi:two-component system OmpR family sensor kinase